MSFLFGNKWLETPATTTSKETIFDMYIYDIKGKDINKKIERLMNKLPNTEAQLK